MEGDNIKSFQNLCNIFEMRIKLDKEKNISSPQEVLENYEKYSKKIDTIYNKSFEKEVKNLISPASTLEKEEVRLKRLIKLLEERLERRTKLEERYLEVTGYPIEGLQLVVSESELQDKKNRLEVIARYLTTTKEIEELTTSISKLKNSSLELEKEKEEYTAKNKEIEDTIYAKLVKSIKEDAYYSKISEETYKSLLEESQDKVRETEETLEVTTDSVQNLIESGIRDDYTQYVEDAEKSYYIWKNREIILEIYSQLITYEEDFTELSSKRERVKDLLEERTIIKNKLKIDTPDELSDFETLVKEQIEYLNTEKEVLDNLVNYKSRIKFKEERLKELKEANDSYEILSILREYKIIDTYDMGEKEIPDEIEEPLTTFDTIIKEEINPYRIKEVRDYPKTLNLGLAKLKGESVREKVNKKLNPKPLTSIFDEFASDLPPKEEPQEEKKEEISTPEEIQTPEKQVEEPATTEPVWKLPAEPMVEEELPTWNQPPEINKVEEELPKMDNSFWIPVSDSKLDTKDFPSINIPLNQNNFSSQADNFGFPNSNN